MRLMLAGIVALGLAGLILAQDAKPDGARAKRLQAIKAAATQAMTEARKPLAEAKTAEERRAANAKVQAAMAAVRKEQAEQALLLVKENPKDQVAFDALLLVIQGAAPNAPYRNDAVVLLKQYHLSNPQLETVLPTLARAGRGYDKSFLKEVMLKSTAKPVKALASLTFAQATLEEAEARGITEDVIKAKVAEGEKILKQVAQAYANVELKTGGKMAELVQRELAGIRLTKVTPEIEAEDVDGKSFKISDYRGKVVLLDFWGHW
jgi:hypothetical protein